MIARGSLFLYTGPVILCFATARLASFFFDDIYFEPIVLAWAAASVNHMAAFWSLTLAQKTSFQPSMLLVFGGGGVRLLLLVSAVMAIIVKKAEWMFPFCIVLLVCFVPYLIIEVAVIYRRGLLQNK